MNQIENNFDDSLKFVAKHYKSGIFNPDKSWQKVTGKRSYSLMRPAVLLRVASIAIILVTIGFIYQNLDQEKVISAKNIATYAVLPDKSEITLQPGAKLTYNKSFNKDLRNVSMQGDISFKVVHNAQKPFIVHTQNTEIKVLGTVFDVKSNTETTELNVISGKVRFAPDNIPVSFVCTKNMSAKYDNTTKNLAVNSPDWSCSVSKNTNRIQFKNTSLTDVCSVLNQYYNVNISLKNQDADVKLTSTFQDKNISEIISIINLTLDTHLTY